MAAGGGRLNNVATPSSNASFLFHLASFLMFLYVFSWHFGRQAASLPQSGGFGWFFKYLTFCGFTFQMVALFTCLLSYLFPETKGVKRLADDLSCASFGIANVITLLYWTIYFLTSKPVEGSLVATAERTVERGLATGPLWRSLIVHLGNAGVAWTDILISERTFRKWSLRMAMLFVILYVIWIHICAAQNEVYPYPFLNAMHQPEGFIVVAVIGLSSIFCFFKAGSKLAIRGSSPQLKKLKLI